VPFDALIPAFAPLAPALAFALRSRAPAP
jgi:hypothetical protein